MTVVISCDCPFIEGIQSWQNQCKSWSAQAWKLLGNVHKPVPKHVYTSCVQEVAKQ